MAAISRCIWETIIQNGWYMEVAPFYSKEFPVEIRSMLSDWLPDISFMSFNIEEPDHRKHALAFIEALIHEIWKRINAFSSEGEANFHHKQRLLKLHKRIQIQDRLQLYKTIRDTISHEKQRVEELCTGTAFSGASHAPTITEGSFSQIQEEIDSVLAYTQLKCQEIDYKIPEMGNILQTWKYNMYRLEQSKRQQNQVNGNSNIYDLDPIPSEEELRNQSSKLSKDMRTLYELVIEVMGLLDSSVHEKVLKELEKWRDNQRLIALGKPTDNKLETIEKWFKCMANCFEILERSLPEFMQLCHGQNLNDEANSISSSIQRVSKTAKRGEQLVVEEKFWIYFRVTVSCKMGTIYLYTTSLPISVTSHPVQEGKAWAHVVWYNAFPLKMRQRFEVPEFIQWSRLIETINYAFLDLGNGLTEEQKDYLKSKIFKGNVPVPTSEMVNKSFFVTDIIATVQPDPNKPEDEKSIKQYTYGEWLHCCLKLISWVPKNGKLAQFGVRKFWAEGKIIGFMSKEEIEKKLRGCSPGTFILRFPENRPENICLYFHDPSVSSKDHLLKQLLSVKDFTYKPLQDRIIENAAAVYLYPNTPKEEAFTKMSKNDCSIVDGYFNVDMQANVPVIILQKIKQVQVTNGGMLSPISSNSALSYGIANSPSTESVQSDHSGTTTGSYTAYNSPYGIDPRLLDELCE